MVQWKPSDKMMTVMGEGCELKEEEEEQFFDSREDVSVFDSCPSSPLPEDGPCLNRDLGNCVDCLCDIWAKNLDCVSDRRDNFMRLLGWDLSRGISSLTVDSDCEGSEDGEFKVEVDRIMLNDGAILGSFDSKNSCSSWSSEGPCMPVDGSSEESSEYRIKSLDDGRVFLVDEFGEDGSLRSLREFGRDHKISIDEFERSFGASKFVQKMMRREDSSSSSTSDTSVRGRRRRWLKRLGAVACIGDREERGKSSYPSDSDQFVNSKIQKVRVHPCKKKTEEFSAVFMCQDLKAHNGAILTMKFSPDGQYLASGGDDGVVRIWRVFECERTNEDDLPVGDPSCIYFSVNRNSELVRLCADKEKKIKSGSLRRTSDSACVVIPSKDFRIQEKPLHEFFGHLGDVVDLSWSKDNHLLSSSTDNTVRLWRLGLDSCVEVFSHNNYVTCIQFNPVNENYFISGSIDGKVRIWEISRCRVVNWIDIREIVTAVCYRPDGKSCIVGTITGDCRFYDASDNHLQLDVQIPLHGRKKSLDKRITGFQFCPSDHRKLMITSADSQVQILDGVDFVCRYKGLRNTGSQISASFTSDGRHIISASEDSHVYIWSHNNQDTNMSNHVKTTWSSERFTSSNASVAIPWNGFEPKSPFPVTSKLVSSRNEATAQQISNPVNDPHSHTASMGDNMYVSPTGSFTFSQDCFAEFMPKGSATWPEEKLPSSSLPTLGFCKSQYNFLKSSCENTSSAWGQVIVTAGWDGRIKCFQNYGLPLLL